jgi:heme/copper-type cytochrome/quinol oxidase subunit 2
MVFVVVLLGVAVLAGLAVWAFRRRGTDEMHSVAGYQHRLERLEELRRRQGGAVRIVGGSTPSSSEEPVLGEDGRIEISSSGARRRVHEDTGQRPPVADRPIPATYRRGRDVSIARMSHRPRQLGAPIAAAVAVIVLVIVLAIVGAHAHPPHAKTDSGTHKEHHKATTTTTTTTVPPTFTASSVSAPDATYSLPPFPSYTVLIKSTGAGGSYVEITTASGSVPYASVLQEGQSEQVTLTGDSDIDLGRPSDVVVEVDKTPVTFPNPLPAPLQLLLKPAPTSTTTTAPSTTTTG